MGRVIFAYAKATSTVIGFISASDIGNGVAIGDALCHAS